jgi:uncharacterized membrane protein YbaN (DUF454 family)
MEKDRIKRWLLVTAGFLSVGLGILGIFLPLLPTTPLLLLGAGCFLRSSPRLYKWLIHRKWFGKYIHHYREHRAVTTQARLVTLALLWGVIGTTAVFAVESWWIRLLLGMIAVGVTWHIVHLKKLTPEMIKASQHMFDGGD